MEDLSKALDLQKQQVCYYSSLLTRMMCGYSCPKGQMDKLLSVVILYWQKEPGERSVKKVIVNWNLKGNLCC